MIADPRVAQVPLNRTASTSDAVAVRVSGIWKRRTTNLEARTVMLGSSSTDWTMALVSSWARSLRSSSSSVRRVTDTISSETDSRTLVWVGGGGGMGGWGEAVALEAIRTRCLNLD